MCGFVYMMSDKPRGVIYVGVTSDLHGRVWEHRNEVRKGYTSKYNAKVLVWFETHPNIVLAIQREKSLKRYLREWKIKLIEGLNPTWLDLYEKIDVVENVFMPNRNTKRWADYN
ncbi:excinuclease ABC subunit C [Rhizobium sp. ACO-34A]|nr:GIY-YIG nuclease family protein [Rhizobium sp. ACO-34A]ATN34576.1 excinuclease ABC subunit C [Rhizobium sp. ACO-34A]